MSDLVLAALISSGITAAGAGLHYLVQTARERGRADAYEASSRLTIEAKNTEIDHLKGECASKLAEKDATITVLRQLLDERDRRREAG